MLIDNYGVDVHAKAEVCDHNNILASVHINTYITLYLCQYMIAFQHTCLYINMYVCIKCVYTHVYTYH